MEKLTRFQIIGLYGTRNIDISIDENTMVFVGENGMGKTTILKFMCAILSGAYLQLPSYVFEKIIVTIDKKSFEIFYKDVSQLNVEINSQVLSNLPAPIRHELINLDRRQKNISRNDIIMICERIGYPVDRLLERISSSDQLGYIDYKKNTSYVIPKTLHANILYLPTYRRIEEDLPNVIKGRYSFSRDNNERRYLYEEYSEVNSNGYIELVEFGMQDVKDKIEKRCSELSRFSESRFKDLAYMNLGDVIDRNYVSSKSDSPVTDHEIEKFKLCLSRSNKEMLSEEQVETLIQAVNCKEIGHQDTHMQILLYYFRNLLALQTDLENKEQTIIDFCDMCNKYLSASDKSIRYDISTFKVQILKQRRHQVDIIDMSDLSSGEKQIVSLFSHLFLTEGKDYFVIIDEPELSLSVPWQKTFLDDIRKSKLCSGIIAATHSPFIYDNDLFPFTHSLGEFIEEEE